MKVVVCRLSIVVCMFAGSFGVTERSRSHMFHTHPDQCSQFVWRRATVISTQYHEVPVWKPATGLVMLVLNSLPLTAVSLHREHPKKYCKLVVFIPLLLFTQFAIFDSIHSITMAAVFEAEERISSVTIEGVVRQHSSLFLFLCWFRMIMNHIPWKDCSFLHLSQSNTYLITDYYWFCYFIHSYIYIIHVFIHFFIRPCSRL